MQLTTVLPAIATVLFVVCCIRILRNASGARSANWVFPAAVCAVFLVFSLWAVVAEGPTGFWPVHAKNLWGNQVWFDLLLATTIGWLLIVPRAKAAGMLLGGWLVLIVCSGSIGFLAMLARLVYLERGREAVPGSPGLSSR